MSGNRSRVNRHLASARSDISRTDRSTFGRSCVLDEGARALAESTNGSGRGRPATRVQTPAHFLSSGSSLPAWGGERIVLPHPGKHLQTLFARNCRSRRRATVANCGLNTSSGWGSGPRGKARSPPEAGIDQGAGRYREGWKAERPLCRERFKMRTRLTNFCGAAQGSYCFRTRR